jgi:hypothetical protein
MKLRVNWTIAPGILYRFVSPDDPKIANALKLVAFQAPREFGEIRDREVVPARGWVVNPQGEVMLVANEVAGQLDDRTRSPVSVCQPR